VTNVTIERGEKTARNVGLPTGPALALALALAHMQQRSSRSGHPQLLGRWL
jgi:hypothetical protein